MEDKEILSSEEVGALLEGMEDGRFPTNSGVDARGEVVLFDIQSSDNVSSYCPASLLNVFTQAARLLGRELAARLRRDVEVSIDSLTRQRYDHFMDTLDNPACVHSFSERSLPGTALVVLDTALVHVFVDRYFGGPGEPGDTPPARSLTPSEVRISQLLLDIFLDALGKAWSKVDDMEFSAQGFDTDPAIVTVAARTESMLVARLTLSLGSHASPCQVVMPLSMLAPVRAKLEASGQGSLRERERFQRSMRSQIKNAPVSLSSTFCNVVVTLRELLSLAPGDVIAVETPSHVSLRIDDKPVLRGCFGASHGMNAVHVLGPVRMDNDTEPTEADS